MKNINKMLKCRAVFLECSAELFGGAIQIDNNFKSLLKGFMENYFNKYYKLFNLICYFDTNDDNSIVLHEEAEWEDTVNKYLSYFYTGNVKEVIKIYDEVGIENANNLGLLAGELYNYVMLIGDMNSNKKIRN